MKNERGGNAAGCASAVLPLLHQDEKQGRIPDQMTLPFESSLLPTRVWGSFPDIFKEHILLNVIFLTYGNVWCVTVTHEQTLTLCTLLYCDYSVT